MNIYFSCSLTGGRDDQPLYAALVDFLLAEGHEVPTAHLAHPEVMQEEVAIDPLVVYQRDIAWLRGCEAVVAEVSTPSHGVGYEIAYALGLGRPVLCLYRQDRRVSKMLTGNTEPGLMIAAYRDTAGALQTVRGFLARLSL